MTSPQIGNYGVAPDDTESSAPKVAGFIMREESPVASNWRASGTLRDYLVAHNVVAIADIDTRELTRLLRSAGVMRGVIATGEADAGELVQQARTIPNMEGTDLVRDVTCASPFDWPDGIERPAVQVRADLALASPDPLQAATPRGGVRLRDQMEHPEAAGHLRMPGPRCSCINAREGIARIRCRWHLPEQRARRSRCRGLRDPERARV